MFGFGRETTVRALGKAWRIGRVDVEAIEEFRDWIAEQVNVRAKYERAKEFAPLFPASAERLFNEAVELEKDLEFFSPETALGQQFMRTLRGMASFYGILLRREHPAITSGEVLGIVREASAELAKARKAAEGQAPAGPEGNAAAPASGRGASPGSESDAGSGSGADESALPPSAG